MSKNKLLKPIHLACGNDEYRPILDHVYINNGYAVATNGHILVKSKLMENSEINDQQIIDSLEGKLIHKDVWKDLIKAARITVAEDKINAYTTAGVIEYPFANPFGEDNKSTMFPNYEKVIADANDLQAVDILGLNSELFATIGKCFKTSGFKLAFNGKTKGVYVTPIDTVDEFALIMPMNLEVNVS